MDDKSVTSDTPEREEKAVADLERGTWVEVIDMDGDYLGEARVLHVETYEDDSLGRRSMLIFQMPGFSPDSIRIPADMTMQLLTEDEVAANAERERRDVLAGRLRALADLIQERNLPVPTHALNIAGYFEKAAAVRVVAEALGVGVTSRGKGQGIQAKRTDGGASYEPGAVTLDFFTISDEPESGAEDLGEGFDRSQTADADETPVPVGSRRHEAHTGAVTDEGLVDETEAVAERCYVPNGFQAPEVVAERVEDCAVSHPGRPCMMPSGLTRAADESRGALAGTTPVVTYFSFGHGQTDPDTSQSLLGHYVTVVAPTYEACREAMFASRFGREWSFDYLAGTEKATNWVSRWTEHDVIVAPGVAEWDAEQALTAAKMLLTGAEPVSEAR